jgi:hypothetical protein
MWLISLWLISFPVMLSRQTEKTQKGDIKWISDSFMIITHESCLWWKLNFYFFLKDRLFWLLFGISNCIFFLVFFQVSRTSENSLWETNPRWRRCQVIEFILFPRSSFSALLPAVPLNFLFLVSNLNHIRRGRRDCPFVFNKIINYNNFNGPQLHLMCDPAWFCVGCRSVLCRSSF